MSRTVRLGVLRETGTVVMEVMVAMVIAALVIVPLAEAVDSVVSRSERARAQARQMAESGDPTGGAWCWGPVVAEGRWTAGPVLDLHVRADDEALVGLWIDGWFRGEQSVDDIRRLSVPVSMWQDSCGAELVVRVREADGPWGPPWRSAVPDHVGLVKPPGPAAVYDATWADLDAGADEVVHLPVLANTAVDISWSAAALQTEAAGRPLRLPAGPAGLCEVGVDGHSQCWRNEVQRGLDLYF